VQLQLLIRQLLMGGRAMLVLRSVQVDEGEVGVARRLVELG
jgi:hypothetical protein